MRDVRTCMPMKNILHILVLVLGLALLLSGCESGKKEAEQADKPKVESAAAASKAEAPAVEQSSEQTSPAPSPADLDRADRLVAFSNAASMALAAGRYAQADVLMAYTKYYLAEWQLAKRPAINPDEDEILARRLAPPVGLFTPEQTKKMAASDRRVAEKPSRTTHPLVPAHHRSHYATVLGLLVNAALAIYARYNK